MPVPPTEVGNALAVFRFLTLSFDAGAMSGSAARAAGRRRLPAEAFFAVLPRDRLVVVRFAMTASLLGDRERYASDLRVHIAKEVRRSQPVLAPVFT